MRVRHILFGMGVVLGGIITSCGTASALTAQEDVDFYFSFNPTLGLTLSGTELTIENLMPGNSATSNSLTITANSNNAAGYKILATVGDGSTYTNTNLVNGSATFTSLSLDANTAIASMANGTWGYSKNGANAYSGLPYVTSTPAVLYNADVSGGGALTFAIGAKAGPAQTAGEYNNVINFMLVGNVVAEEIGGVMTMQEFAQMTAAQKTSVLNSMVPGAIYTLEDIRDGNLYEVSKLADGNVWMTKNLDLCIGCTGTAALTSANTDLNSDLGSAAGYSIDAGLITWTPAGNATVTGTPAEITNFAAGDPENSVTGWASSQTKPYMATGSLHEQTGNYYNYTAAIAMNDSSSISANYTVAPNSICPAGWRLPNGLTQTGGTVNISDFNTLLNAYGIAGGNDTAGAQNVSYATGGFAKMETDPLSFARSGFVSGTILHNYATSGRYWLSTAYSSTYSYGLRYGSGLLYPADWSYRDVGRSVRCMLR